MEASARVEEAGTHCAEAASPRFWGSHTAELRRELAAMLPRRALRELHQLSPARHFLVAGCLFALMAFIACTLAVLRRPSLWVPLALIQGILLFDCTVLLHEALHRLVWLRRRERARGLLMWLYALPSGLSPSQFARWHLDHHAELGSATLDPKRHRLSPKRNARWLKLLYFTPGLFVIYFSAAARETATYPEALRRRVRRERLACLALHAAALAAILSIGGSYALLRIYLVPYLVGFPLAFSLNRLGQHYDVDPSDPARWGTRMRRLPLWDWAFLWSGYHLEHHYFPGVPFYNLRRLNALLSPFFEARGIPERSYGWLLWNYIGRNRPPHALWEG